jgi:hypothetical protein
MPSPDTYFHTLFNSQSDFIRSAAKLPAKVYQLSEYAEMDWTVAEINCAMHPRQVTAKKIR